MPIVAWKCKKCEEKFTNLQKNSDPKPKCPKCDSEDVEKDYNYKGKSPGVNFVGNGYYENSK